MSDEIINRLCEKTTNATVLNALHACRHGHPLGKNNNSKWWTAYALCAQYPLIFQGDDMTWLKDRAINS